MKRIAILFALIIFVAACARAEEVPPTTAVSETNDLAETETNVPLSTPELPPFTPALPDSLAELDIDALHEQIFAELLRRDPQYATELSVAEQFGIDEGLLTDVSDAYQDQTDQLIRDYLALLEAIDPATLTPAQKLSNDILIWDLGDQVEGIAFRYHTYLINQLFSIPIDLPAFMVGVHPLENHTDAENYVRRLAQVGSQFDQVIAGMEIRAERGLLPPRFVFDRVLTQLRSLVAVDVTDNEMATHFATQVGSLDLASADEQMLLDSVASELESGVYPAYERLIESLSTLQTQATDDDGVWKLPGGGAYYAYTLSHHTTTEMTAAEIHELGLQEVERIQGEMVELLAELGYGTDLSSGIGQIYRNGGGIQINNDQTRQDVFATYEAALAEADDLLSPLFNIQPQAPLEIRRVPAFREASAPGAYYTTPPLDGSRPGIFWINTPNGRFVSYVGIPTLAFHEGFPGHHFQKAIQSELQDVPTFRRALGFGAYAEGWALYVEKLAWEYGYYEDDPFGNWGRLQSELFRAVRLVVDTGIHDQGWTRQEAIDYMVQTLNWSPDNVTAEVERYIVWPGQATSYKIGELTILRLRNEAQAALGDEFDIAEFHTLILRNGDVPLGILEQIIEQWVSSQ